MPRTHHPRRAVPVELHHAGGRQSEEPSDLLGHLLEHATRWRLARDECGDPAQRGLFGGQRALSRLGRSQREARARALGGDRGEHERRERRDRDEELRGEQAVVDRPAHERPLLLRCVPDGDRADDEDRRRRSARAEAERRPQEHREHDVRHVSLRRQLGEEDQHHERDRALDEVAPADALQARGRPRQHDRRDDEDAGHVAQRPCAKHAPELVCGDHVPEAQRQRPERGADDRRHQRTGHERHDVGDTGQIAPAPREAAQQQRRHHERQRVADRLPEHGAERRREVSEEQVADGDAGPEADAVEEQHGEPQSRGRPQRRHGAVEIRELEPDPAGDVVGDGHQRDGQPVPRETLRSHPAQRFDLRTNVAAAFVRTGGERCVHGARAESSSPSTR